MVRIDNPRPILPDSKESLRIWILVLQSRDLWQTIYGPWAGSTDTDEWTNNSLHLGNISKARDRFNVHFDYYFQYFTLILT